MMFIQFWAWFVIDVRVVFIRLFTVHSVFLSGLET